MKAILDRKILGLHLKTRDLVAFLQREGYLDNLSLQGLPALHPLPIDLRLFRTELIDHGETLLIQLESDLLPEAFRGGKTSCAVSLAPRDLFEHSQRALGVAIFNLLGSLAQKLTGETPLLCLDVPREGVQHVYPSTELVQWAKGKRPPQRCILHGQQGHVTEAEAVASSPASALGPQPAPPASLPACRASA
jgi:hypothetical protein